MWWKLFAPPTFGVALSPVSLIRGGQHGAGGGEEWIEEQGETQETAQGMERKGFRGDGEELSLSVTIIVASPVHKSAPLSLPTIFLPSALVSTLSLPTFPPHLLSFLYSTTLFRSTIYPPSFVVPNVLRWDFFREFPLYSLLREVKRGGVDGELVPPVRLRKPSLGLLVPPPCSFLLKIALSSDLV
ncbi:hypothetical protein PoB_000244800 [Plakobranchus ocellatus]|uniref:Uncharacterized protein n=1 Tax=Plakobranchus ocellatus TaxID=259542 RepID=A0AAV3Y0S3_9GAST|nr:hypothetical protein PoB_000244800 [Plakobranchus ocellatus]